MSTLYIDESKARGYVIVSAVVMPSDVGAIRKALDDLRKRGQNRIHFVKESNSRRREILSQLERLRVTARVYDADARTDAAARELCLNAMIEDAVKEGVTRIVLERDDSIVRFDQRILFRELDARGARERISYVHETAAREPLLALPDAIAWSVARGGEWASRAAPLISETRRLR